ncbi:CDP-alcohol phosphatidyltransferase family protein [Enterococcus sp. HY326]|uniref:CDP-alcohol phosphatidyltransferase family protein n=1 Tax=Enterococcus sp. HY326 TaxID=2971265 RepID=UPI00223E9255|nr:CDP-alcohol phosphatidyltransferase family protein [Enterococcus sp. HY326]
MRVLANLFSFSRIIAAPFLIFFGTESWEFLAIYLYCGVSDILDGRIAKTAGIADEAGFHADLIGDLAFLFIVLIRLGPQQALLSWELVWLAGILFFKVVAIIIAYDKFQRFILVMPTFLNRWAWVCLFFVPFYKYLEQYLKIETSSNLFLLAFLLLASLAVIEELSIILLSKEYNFQVKSIFMLDKI